MSEKDMKEKENSEVQDISSEEGKGDGSVEKEPVIPKEGSEKGEKQTGKDNSQEPKKSNKKASGKKKKPIFSQEEIDQLILENEQLKSKSAELEDKYVRLFAEVENYKKRSSRDMLRTQTLYKDTIFIGLLAIMDDMQRVTDHMVKDKLPEAKAVQMVWNKLLAFLEKYDVKPFHSVGESFDPEKHDAMLTRKEDDKEDNIVLEEFEKGYMIGNRVLRHAKVIVNILE